MDLNDIRIAITLLSLIAFLGIVRWAYHQRRAPAFERAALAVLESDTAPAPVSAKEPS